MTLNLPCPSLTAASCAECNGECLASCFNDAIIYDKEFGYRVIEDNCAGCGACTAACDPGLIFLADGIACIAEPQTVT